LDNFPAILKAYLKLGDLFEVVDGRAGQHNIITAISSGRRYRTLS
jgi:hypothetical protein